MRGKAQDDNLVMELVQSTLTQPTGEREQYLKNACSGNPELFAEVWDYVQLEQRMNGFLLDPVCQPFALEHTFEPGEILDGRFRILRAVAEGGMGVVYEAVDERLKRRIAIKCAKAGFRKQLPPEVRNATEVSHPNVCKIFEIYTISTPRGKIDFLTMEFLDGETLSQRLRRGALPESERRELALQLCAGLAEAHRKGVIHGDLKSNNVILTRAADGSTRAVITDFGLAQQPAGTDGIALSGVRGGTPEYMAPELLRGDQSSVASDIYALGVILHELACGKRPATTGEPPLPRLNPKQISSAKWNGIITHCLQTDPAQRFQSANEVALAFAPSRFVRWATAAAAVILVAATSVWATYYKAAPPKENVRLAMMPLPHPLENLSRDVEKQLARLSGGSSVNLKMIPLKSVVDARVDSPAKVLEALGATHVLHVAAKPEGDSVGLRVYLADKYSGSNHEWPTEYAPAEQRYIPVALAGFVSDKLGLPPPQPEPSVNAAAMEDYLAGLASVELPSTIDDAIWAFSRAVEADPDSPLTHAGLAEAEWIKYRLTKEEAWLDQARSSAANAARRQPDVALVHRILGSLEIEAGRHDKAEPEFLRAIKLNPSDAESHRRLGQAYQKYGQIDEARVQFLEAVRVDPDNVAARKTLGTFYYNRGQFDDAGKEFEYLVTYAGHLPESHYALGTTYCKIGWFDRADMELRKAIKIRDSPEFRHALGYNLMHQLNDREAINQYQTALRLETDAGQEHAALLYLNLGVSYARIGNDAKARDAFQEGIRLASAQVGKDGANGRALAELAYLFARLQNREFALLQADQALSSLWSQDRETRWMVAATYEALGEHPRTLRLLKSTHPDMLPGLLGELYRYPEMESLKQDSDFQTMLGLNKVK